MDQLLQKSALSLAGLFAAGEVSPVEMARVTLDRQAEIDKVLNTSYLQTPELALKQAAASEKRWWAGKPNSALDGIPTTIKDGLWWANYPVHRGFAGTAEHPAIPVQDAPVTARMAEAGMVFVGKTTMPDFGMLASGYSSHHGITRNPRDCSKNPGGSSSGVAAAIAAGAYPVGVGTDIVGSIRLPASFCGLFGLKPSQGRVPYYPPASPALVAGPMTRNVADAAALMDILTQADGRDFTALPAVTENYLSNLKAPKKKLKFGLIPQLNLGVEADGEVVSAIIDAASTLEGLGHQILELESPLEPADLDAGELWYQQRVFNEMQSCSEEQKQRSPYLQAWTKDCASVPAGALFMANERLWNIRARLAGLFEQVDYLLCPAVPFPAFDAELPAPNVKKLFEPWASTFIFNLGEMPASSINCGFTRNGLPIGLQIVGQRFDDLGVLQVSHQFEQHCNEALVPPCDIVR